MFLKAGLLQNSSNNLSAIFIIVAVIAGVWCVVAIAQAILPDRYYDGKIVNVTVGDGSTLSIECKDYPGELEHCAFIRVHGDEYAALDAGRAFVEKHGGRLINLSYGGGRRVQFSMGVSKYVFDANRMYSRSGLAQVMIDVPVSAAEWEIKRAERGVYDPVPLKEALKYSEQVLRLLEGFDVVIALHNDTNGGWNVRSYSNEPAEASQVFVSDGVDTDDFFIVTHESDFEAIKALGMNTVLQNNALVPEDGSLSVHYRNSETRYINCEAEDGEIGRQSAMLEAIYPLLVKSDNKAGADESSIQVNSTN